MCGLFGLVRNPNAEHGEWATAALAELGDKATTRGRDSAGLAYISINAQTSSRPALKAHAESGFTQMSGGVVVHKGAGAFSDVWRDDKDIELAQASSVVIGHTRTATQGNTSDYKNMSPMPIGTVIGTHNGDIDDTTIEKWIAKGNKVPFGATDTETLFRAIHEVRSHRKKISDILTDVHGRVAIAWYDRRLTDRVYLARGGMAPLAIAFDSEGNMYWASNPQWFRDIDKKFDGLLGFHSIMMVPEGRLITVKFNGEPMIDDMREFVPTVRQSDTYLPDRILWRDYTDEDQKADKASFTHKVYSGYKPKNTKVKSSYTSRPVSPRDYEWDDIANSSRYGSTDHYSEVSPSFGIDWLAPDYDDTSSAAMDMMNYLEACNDEEGNEAIAEASLFIDEERAGRVGGTYVRQALYEAVKSNQFDGVVRDYKLSNAKVARAFAELVLSQAP